MARGAGELLVTSMDTDGTKQGYALDLMGAILQRVPVPVIASGGASGPDHIADALAAGCSAALAASIFHDATYTVAGGEGHVPQPGAADALIAQVARSTRRASCRASASTPPPARC